MSEQSEIWYIPGDELCFDLEDFEHEQHVSYVRIVYALADDRTQELWLEGDAKESAPPRRESPQRVIYTSRARVTGIIRETLKAGRYWLWQLEAHTYGGAVRQFQKTAESANRQIPSSILVQPEPHTDPRFLGFPASFLSPSEE